MKFFFHLFSNQSSLLSSVVKSLWKEWLKNYHEKWSIILPEEGIVGNVRYKWLIN